MKSFHCKTCGLLLADGLSECREDALCLEDGMPMLPPKTFCTSEGKHPPEVAGDYLINVDELINARLYIESRGRLNGCCGLDGLDGINHVCQNGHEVATVRTDCWMPSHCILSSNKVTLSEPEEAR